MSRGLVLAVALLMREKIATVLVGKTLDRASIQDSLKLGNGVITDGCI